MLGFFADFCRSVSFFQRPGVSQMKHCDTLLRHSGVLFQAAVQGAAADAQIFCGAGSVSSAPPQSFEHIALVRSRISGSLPGCGSRFSGSPEVHLEGLEHLFLRAAPVQQQRDSLDRVGQFTDIAGPRIGAASAQHPEKGGFLVGGALGHHPVVNGTGNLQDNRHPSPAAAAPTR